MVEKGRFALLSAAYRRLMAAKALSLGGGPGAQ